MLSVKKSQIEIYLEPVAKKLSGINPNILTLLGSIPPLLFFVSVLYNQYIVALIAFLGTSFDLIDGMVARKYNKVTKFGGLFDSLMDRIGDFLFITAFSFAGIVRWEITAPLLLFSFLTSYIRSRAGLAAMDHMKFAVGIIERPERLGFIFFTLIAYLIFPSLTWNELNIAELLFILLSILSLITVLQRMQNAYKEL